LVELVHIGAELNHAADVDAQEVNLIDKTGRAAEAEVGEVGLAELGSVETVLEGVAVAGLAAATTLGGRGTVCAITDYL
jgi:hypothetical protein